ncbi:9843_t:CDS:2 [Cetraspora pellucida]|uniref:9843_t:CDS:1 n=1 Tax=Cetraspora pellucida TaxID=1433469 RepID=A0A9N9F9T6_9GLOM|nr:9843_t:CDS:2 [Cetraspora pellucida]
MSNKKHIGRKLRHNLTGHIITTNKYVNLEKPTFEIDSDNDNYDLTSIYSEQTTRSTGSTTSQNTNQSQISNSNKIFNFLAHIITHKEQAQFEKQILNITIENKSAERMQSVIKTKAQEDLNDIMLVFDEWKNVAKQEILGSILVTSKGELLIWDAKDITEYRMEMFDDNIEGLYTQLKPKSLLPELKKFHKQQKPFTLHVANQFASNILDYWGFCSDLAKELSKLDNSEILTDSTQNNQDYTIVISDSENEEIQEQERNSNAMNMEEAYENATGNKIDHPLINKNAKWNLSSLFSQNLPTLPYLFELEK